MTGQPAIPASHQSVDELLVAALERQAAIEMSRVASGAHASPSEVLLRVAQLLDARDRRQAAITRMVGS